MNKTIWKIALEITDGQRILVPIGAQTLTVQTQNGKPVLWILVDPLAEKEIRTIEIFGTGNPIPLDQGTYRKYIATIQVEGRRGSGDILAFHVIENHNK